jgi:RecJ-like exonuclease
MPRQMWKPLCSCQNYIHSTEKTCTTCGRDGEYAGWWYIAHEEMANHQIRYGTKPIGPHRRFSDDLFAGVYTPCAACSGRGLLNSTDEAETFQHCPACEGLGATINCTTEEFEAKRQRLLKEFPDAAVHGWAGKSPSGAYMFNPSEGMVEEIGCTAEELEAWRRRYPIPVASRPA